MPDRPQPFSVREREGQWEVLISSPDMWFQVDSADDARVLAQSVVLRHEILDEGRRDDSVASECKKTAAVLAKYRIGWLSRWFESRGAED